jgi:hypothetical protein
MVCSLRLGDRRHEVDPAPVPDAPTSPSRRTVDDCVGAFLRGAMGATEDDVTLLDAMPDDAATAMRTGGRKFLDCALETVEGVGLRGNCHLESLVIVIPALIAFGHCTVPSTGDRTC